jgi:hypothetical protein
VTSQRPLGAAAEVGTRVSVWQGDGPRLVTTTRCLPFWEEGLEGDDIGWNAKVFVWGLEYSVLARFCTHRPERACPIVGCNLDEPHDHNSGGPSEVVR